MILDLQEFDYIKYEVLIASAWIDLSEDVCITPEPHWNVGIMTNGQLDRVGDGEAFTFSLRNDANNSAGLIGRYSPGHANCLSGWTTGLEIRLTFSYQTTVVKVKYSGTIDKEGINVASGVLESRKVSVSCHGFMDKAASHKLNLMTLRSNIRINEAVAYILANMPVQPKDTSYAIGNSIFPYAFDTMNKNTRAIGEFEKLAVSELGYIYTLSNGTLRVEARDTRTSTTMNTYVPNAIVDSGFLLKEDGGYLLKEDGGRIRLNQITEADFSNAAMRPGPVVTYGADLANYIAGIIYPRRIDAAATTVLFTLQKSLYIAAGDTLTGVRGEYRDPSGGASYVSGTEMVTPTTPTHYKAYANEDGTGTDLSANLVISGDPLGVAGRPNYGTDAVEYTLHNSGGTGMWVTVLKAVGKGIYLYDTVTIISEDPDSQGIHGVNELVIDMRYQATPSVGEAFANFVLSREKQPSQKVNSFPIFANKNSFSIMAFMLLEPGDRAHFSDEMTAIDSDYFINGYEAYIVNKKRVVWKLVLKKVEVNNGWRLGTSLLGRTTKLGATPFG